MNNILISFIAGTVFLLQTHALHPPPLRIVLDVGHSPLKSGATSARGVSEYQFNHNIVNKLHNALQQAGFDSFILTHKQKEMGLTDRANLASVKKADVLLSIHHDSVQPRYLSSWTYDNKRQRHSEKFQGHSLFISRRNSYTLANQQLAESIGESLYQQGKRPTLHHNERIMGENRELYNKKLGIYYYDNLLLLRKSRLPAVLLECGVIVNRDEEQKLADPQYQQQLIEGIIEGLKNYQKKI